MTSLLQNRAPRHARVRKKRVSTQRWIAPAVFGVFERNHRSALLRSLRKLRQLFMTPTAEPIHLDFGGTESLFADGMLLFYAELLRLIKATEGRHSISTTLSPVGKVCQVFDQIGLCSLLGVSTPSKPKDDDVVHWRFARGQQAEGKKYEDILADYDGSIAEPLQELLYTGLTEAMTNVMNHAYDEPRGDGLGITGGRDWWMFSQYREGYLSVVFCDLGAGIPATIQAKRPKVWERYLLLGHGKDSAAIAYSVRDSISRTKLDHRGKGLGQIFSIVDAVAQGRVAVFSNCGMFSRQGEKQRKREYKDSIFGTLIHWKLPVEIGNTV